MTRETQIVLHLSLNDLEEVLERRDQRLIKALTDPTAQVVKPLDVPDLATPKQTAAVFQVSLVTLRKWSMATDDRPAILVPIKINGRHIRYRREDVLAALRESHRYKRIN